MTYLLDTNTCIALINGNPRGVRRRLDRVFGAGASAAVSAVTAFELWYGAAKNKRRETNMRRLETFFAGPLDLLPFEPGDAHAAGAIRSALESADKPIGAYDVLIAGQAMNRAVTLVTANVAEFGRIPGLRREDWAK